jgi:hypothetical protein
VKSTAAALLVVSLAVPALAQDVDPAKPPVAPAPAPAPAGGDSAKPAAPADAKTAKKERKTTPEAEAAIKRYADQLAFPPADAKSFHFVSDVEIPQLGGSVTLDYRWEKDKTPVAKVELPEATRDQIPEQFRAMIEKQMAEQMGAQLAERIDAKLTKYNLSHKAEKDGIVVEITAFDEEKCEFDSGKLIFDANGLLSKQTVTPHVDPNNPQSAMMAGVEIEIAFKHAKKGDRYAIDTITQTMPMGEVGMTFQYFELKDSPVLPKSIEITSAMMPAPMTVAYHDWEVDGKAIAGTEMKKPEAEKPAEKPADKPAEKPADKPADPPKEDAPK